MMYLPAQTRMSLRKRRRNRRRKLPPRTQLLRKKPKLSLKRNPHLNR
jgi:hypothetical protein